MQFIVLQSLIVVVNVISLRLHKNINDSGFENRFDNFKGSPKLEAYCPVGQYPTVPPLVEAFRVVVIGVCSLSIKTCLHTFCTLYTYNFFPAPARPDNGFDK